MIEETNTALEDKKTEPAFLVTPSPRDKTEREMAPSFTRLANKLLEANPNCNNEHLVACLEVLSQMFHELNEPFLTAAGELTSNPLELLEANLLPAERESAFPPNLELHTQNELHLFWRESLGFLRRKTAQSIFDVPSQRLLNRMKKQEIVHQSKRVSFNRLTLNPGPETHQNPSSPIILANWEYDLHGDRYLQFSVALPDEQRQPRYLFKIAITDKDTSLPKSIIAENQPLPESQDAVYWDLVLHAAELSLKDRKYPYAAIIDTAGPLSPIIVARNRNWQLGQTNEGHAEHLALIQMNDMNYKVEKIDPQVVFAPKLYSLAEPCHSCAQMAREQGVAEVHYILGNPGFSGKRTLLDPELTEECGPPPKVIQAQDLIPRALLIIKNANSPHGLFPGQFNKTIANNEAV